MSPPYKDKMNRYITQSLFKEMYTGNDRHPPVFTLKEFDDGDLPSIRRLFIEFDDPTGYEFAMAYLGSYEHWKELLNCKWFVPYLEEWLDELRIKREARALKKIKEVAEGNSNAAFQAAKWLAEYEKKQKRVGRPEKEKKQAPVDKSEVEKEYLRLVSG